MKNLVVTTLHRNSNACFSFLFPKCAGIDKNDPSIVLRREIVYETNFCDFREFLPNSRNQILAKNPPGANSRN